MVTAVEGPAFLHRDDLDRLSVRRPARVRLLGRANKLEGLHTFIGIGGEQFGLGDPISPAIRKGLAGYERAITCRLGTIGGAMCG